MAKRPSASAATTAAPGRIIFLFSDGTGNSSAKLQKTNVWRFYEALDLGSPPAGANPNRPLQIAYYDNGVGTSSVPLLAALGGVFGFGLARNVRGLYTYLCRNYRPGDRIFVMGFSRGAFTIRLLAGLVAQMGIVRADREALLELKVHDAWRLFRQDFNPYVFTWPTRFLRWCGRGLINFKRAIFGQPAFGRSLDETDSNRPRPDVDFVGVWDTVSAYGGPIVEFTRAIDMMVWPLSMNDFRLNPKIKCARHALAIDDKRDSFIPLPWDEKHESDLVANMVVDPDRLQQVFFAGMHADVGGGYADESLSLVSLVWMIEQAKRCGARLLPVAEDRIRRMANDFGPMHDSRNGIGMLYRYQIRPIIAWLRPRRPASWPQLDPATERGPVKPGTSPATPSWFNIGAQRRRVFGRRALPLLMSPITVHRSVTDRLDNGTDGYAPNNLPVMLRVVDDKSIEIERRTNPMVARSAGWTDQIVAFRRTAYFATIAMFGLLLWLPFLPVIDEKKHPWLHALFSVANDDRDLSGPLYTIVRGLLPGFAHRWTDVWVAKFWLTLPVVAITIGVIALGVKFERKMADHYSAVYRRGAGNPVQPYRLISRIIRSRRLNRANAIWKWYVVPFAVGSALLFAAIVSTLASVSQAVMFAGKERSTCKLQRSTLPVNRAPIDFTYAPYSICNDLKARVKAGETYTIELTSAAWSDDGIDAGPDGWERLAFRNWFWGATGVPFRRVVRAPYLAPIVEIQPDTGFIAVQRVEKVALLDQAEGRWTGQFKAAHSGRLGLFLNDSVMPLAVRDAKLRVLDPGYAAANNVFRDNCLKRHRGRIWNSESPPTDELVESCGNPIPPSSIDPQRVIK